jgi:hypothetical protein
MHPLGREHADLGRVDSHGLNVVADQVHQLVFQIILAGGRVVGDDAGIRLVPGGGLDRRAIEVVTSEVFDDPSGGSVVVGKRSFLERHT